MNPVLLATLGGIGVLVLWGVSDWLIAKSSKRFALSEVSLALRLPMALIGIALLLSAGTLPSLEEALILSLAGLFFFITYLIFIKALSVGEAGVVVPIANIYPVVTLALTSVFLGISFTSLQVVSVGVIVLGAMLIGVEKTPWRNLRKHFSLGLMLALAAALFWGVAFASVGPIIKTVPWQVGVGVLSVSQVFYALIFWALQNRGRIGQQLGKVGKNKTGMSAGVMLLLGTVVFYISSQATGNTVIPATIAAASPLVTSALAGIFDHEKLIPVKRLGAVVVVVGIILLNWQ